VVAAVLTPGGTGVAEEQRVGDTSQTPGTRKARGSTLLRRPRVTDLLSAARTRRATLVVAGAGYGKTTALAEVAGMGASRWVRVRPADAPAESLSARIAAALGEFPAPQRSQIAAATGSDDRLVLAERRAVLLCELAETLHEDLLLVVDGLEHVGADQSASHLLRVLSLAAPARLHLVLSGRSLPELGLGGAQGRGELLEVTAPDLSFTLAETADLVQLRLGTTSSALAHECWSVTGGCAAALALLLDRLERLDPGERGRALTHLRHSRGRVWKHFAQDLLASEQPHSRRILTVAAVAPRVDPGVLAGVGAPAIPDDLEGLRERGLLVEAGGPGFYRLSPVLVGAFPGPSTGTDTLRQQVAHWLEDHARQQEALECHAAGAGEAARSFLRRRGPELIRGGAAARVIEVLRLHGTASDPDLDALLAEALQAVGDWDAAIDLFAKVERMRRPGALPASVAWRYGVLLYLRGQTLAAAATLSAAHDPARLGADDAMVTAWLSTTLWSQGRADAAAELAATALHQAGASGDSCALAAAHVALALAAASHGERERNEQEYRLALAAAREGGDLVQVARIHANSSSRALESGAYRQAVAEAEQALETGAGHRFFSALALTNKAEAHLRLGELDDARAALAEAAAIYEALGSLHASLIEVLYGELYRQRGDMVRARGSFERAAALAGEVDDAHTLVSAFCGLARVLAEEDISAARTMATDAMARASSLERAAALCAAAEVELAARDVTAAGTFARTAEAHARATGDRAALAESLELSSASVSPADESRLRAAIELWEDIGNPVSAARARLALAILTDDMQAADLTQRELAAMGVAPAIGAGGRAVSRRGSSREVAIVSLGRFAVLRSGEPVALAAWQSRKARDLLKVLVARRGRPMSRDAAAEALWPEENPEPLGNRLSVALSTIRKVLDPGRQHPPDYYLTADTRTIAVRPEHLNVDLIEFLRVADQGIDLMSEGAHSAAEGALRRARQIYAGDFLEEDLYEDWAVEAREEARSRLLMVLRLLARLADGRGDDELAVTYLGQLLEHEPYDEDAWLALIAGHLRLRRHGEARRRYASYARRMGELSVVPVPLTQATAWRP
jgi:ATP/maltotriose-dependent transcriptional regulator MalT/DNA-binding SARP family transcriptional activator